MRPPQREAVAQPGPMGGWIGRDLESGPAAGRQHPADLAHVTQDHLPVGDVLEHDAREHRVHRAVRHPGQGGPVAEHELDVAHAVEVVAGAGQHLRGDVERDHPSGPFGQRPREPADAASQIEDGCPRRQL